MANKVGPIEQIMSRLTVILAITLLFLLIAACNSAESTTLREQQATTDATLELGATVYAASCASCHGVNLEGQPDWKTPNPDGTWKAPPHNDDGHTWHHSDDYLIDRIVNGTNNLDANMQQNSNMPAYGDILSDEEINAVLAFIKSEWSPRVQEMQSQR